MSPLHEPHPPAGRDNGTPPVTSRPIGVTTVDHTIHIDAHPVMLIVATLPVILDNVVDRAGERATPSRDAVPTWVHLHGIVCQSGSLVCVEHV